MFSTEVTLHPIHRAICLFFAALIVSGGLAAGFVGAQVLEQQAALTLASLHA